MPKISIIVPVYNVAQYLPQCLTSILSQDYKDYEIICINDGSTDGSGSMLKEYSSKFGPRFQIIEQENRGMSFARNKGVLTASGEYVIFVDSDDWLEDNALSILSEALKGDDIVCFGSRKYIQDTGEYLNNNRPQISGTVLGWDYFNQQRLIPTEVHFVCIWQRAYRREFLLKNGLFFNEDVRRAEDDLFSTMSMYYAKTLSTIPQSLYVYRVRANSITTTVDIDRWYDSLKVQEILVDFFVPLRCVEKKVIYKVLASNYINWFSMKTCELYGCRDKELFQIIDWSNFKKTASSKKHRLLFLLIKVSPKMYRLYERSIFAIR